MTREEMRAASSTAVLATGGYFLSRGLGADPSLLSFFLGGVAGLGTYAFFMWLQNAD